MKLTADRDGNLRRFSAKLGWKEYFDPKEIQILSAREIPMLIPPMTVQGRRNNIIQYDISNYSTLEFYLTCILSREQFAEIMLQCLETFQRMQQIYLSYKNLVLDLDKIYIMLKDRSVHFIYLPLVASKREVSLADFFRALIAKAVRSTYEQSKFLDACLEWLDQPSSFIPSEFERFIRDSIGVVISANEELTKASPTPKDAEEAKPIPYVPPRPVDEGNWPPKDETDLLDYSPGYPGGTIILGEDGMPAPKTKFFILRIQTGEKIELNHSPFLVGTELGSVDYCVSGNAAVSRKHAEFELRDGDCTITDQKSTNKTYINNCVLTPFTAQVLNDGDEIRLGNEAFRLLREELT